MKSPRNEANSGGRSCASTLGRSRASGEGGAVALSKNAAFLFSVQCKRVSFSHAITQASANGELFSIFIHSLLFFSLHFYSRIVCSVKSLVCAREWRLHVGDIFPFYRFSSNSLGFALRRVKPRRDDSPASGHLIQVFFPYLRNSRVLFSQRACGELWKYDFSVRHVVANDATRVILCECLNEKKEHSVNGYE